MEVSLHLAAQCVLLWAIGTGILYSAYMQLRQWNAALPFGAQSAIMEVRSWGAGAAAGQVILVLYLTWAKARPFDEALSTSGAAVPFFLPLYIALCVPTVAKFTAHHIPAFMALLAAVTVMVYHALPMLYATAKDAKDDLGGPVLSVALGYMAMTTFQWTHRSNLATIFIIQDWEAQGRPVLWGLLFARMHLITGYCLVALLTGIALGVLKGDWWLMGALTLLAAPSVPNPLTERFSRPVDQSATTNRHLVIIGAVLLLMILSPMGPLAWGFANQIWWTYMADWRNIELLEEVQDTAPAWPLLLHWTFGQTAPARGGRILGAGPVVQDYGTAAVPPPNVLHVPPPPPPAAAASSPPPIRHSATIPAMTPAHSNPAAVPTPLPTPAAEMGERQQRELRARAAEERIRRLQEQQQEVEVV